MLISSGHIITVENRSLSWWQFLRCFWKKKKKKKKEGVMEEETSWKLCTGSPAQAHDHSLSQKDYNMGPIRSCSCSWSSRRTVNLDSFIKGFTQPTRRMSQYYPTSIKLKTHILVWKICKMKLDYRA